MKSEEKLLVEICCGTSCYILGGKELLAFSEICEKEFAEQVELRAVPCLDACSTDNLGAAPFVRINGVVVGGMTPQKLRATIEMALEGGIRK